MKPRLWHSPFQGPESPGSAGRASDGSDRFALMMGGGKCTLTSSPPGRPGLSKGQAAVPQSHVLKGIAVSPGVAIGPALLLDPRASLLPARSHTTGNPERELARLESALEAARRDAELAELEAKARLGPEYAAILAAHVRMIDDPTLRRQAREMIESDRLTAEHAVFEVLERLAKRLEGLLDAHLSARAADVRDIQTRILESLAGAVSAANPPLLVAHDAPPGIVLAQDLSPSQTARLDPARVLGFATEAGGRTSHTAIVAAGLEIPAVVGIGPFLGLARHADQVVIDGDEGLVLLDPDAETLARYQAAAKARAARFAALSPMISLPAESKDGTRVELLGNIEFPEEVKLCRERGADGVGLFRTEFLFLNADRAPSEDEQAAVYREVVRSMQGKPVTIRTLDLGADKLGPAASSLGAEHNPYLGLRSLRLSLRDLDVFRVQLRALLRAASAGPLRVMFPLVSTLGEFRDARRILADEAAALRAEGVNVPDHFPVGAMIEVPAAALMADRLADEVDFFSIGTNDLIQYTLAVDRTNENVAYLYNAADPSVLRLIRMVVEAARPRRIPVNVCGSMGGEPLFTTLLIGLGLRQLSMPPHQLLEVKRVLRAVEVARACELATAALERNTAAEVQALLIDSYTKLAPEQADRLATVCPSPADGPA